MPGAAQSCRSMKHAPLRSAHGLLQSPTAQGAPCARTHQPPGSAGYWLPSYPSIPPSSGGLPLPGKSVLGFGAGLSDSTPPPKGLEGLSPTTLPVATSQGRLGCSSFCLKKTEDKRVRKRILLGAYCGHCKSRKGFDRTDEACFHNVQIGTLTRAGQEMQVMAGTRLLPHIAAG